MNDINVDLDDDAADKIRILLDGIEGDSKQESLLKAVKTQYGIDQGMFKLAENDEPVTREEKKRDKSKYGAGKHFDRGLGTDDDDSDDDDGSASEINYGTTKKTYRRGHHN